MRITSIRERPEYIPALLTSLEEHWPACMPWIKKHMEEVLRTGGPLPDAYVAVEKGKVVGGYTLAYKEILWSTDTGLWIATLYVDPGFRGKHRPRPPAGLGAGGGEDLPGLRTHQLLREVWLPYHRPRRLRLGRTHPDV